MNNKAVERDVRLCLRAIHINGTFQNHAENTDNYLYETGKRLRYSQGSSRRNSLKIEGVKEGKAGNETRNQYREKVSGILKSKLEIKNVKIERAQRIPKRKKVITKTNPVPSFSNCIPMRLKEA